MVWIILGIVAALVLWYVVTYNGLVASRERVTQEWGQIDTQLKRRNDLIPNLVSTVKGYAKHEQETLEKVVALRNQLTAGDLSAEQAMDVSTQLSQQLKSVFALAEAYPDLKANTNFLALQEELVTTENKISYARQLYNKTVTHYNIQIKQIPSSIVASIGGFKEEQVLVTPEEEKSIPKVEF